MQQKKWYLKHNKDRVIIDFKFKIIKWDEK